MCSRTRALISALDRAVINARAALPPRNTRYPFYSRLVVPQGQSERVLKFAPPTGFLSLDGPSGTEPLHQLSHRGQFEIHLLVFNVCMWTRHLSWLPESTVLEQTLAYAIPSTCHTLNVRCLALNPPYC